MQSSSCQELDQIRQLVVESPQVLELRLESCEIAARYRSGDRFCDVARGLRLLQGSESKMEVTTLHSRRESEPLRELAGTGQQRSDATRGEGRRQMVEGPRLRWHLDGNPTPSLYQAFGEAGGFSTPIDSEYGPLGDAGIGENSGKGLQWVERADSRAGGGQGREDRGIGTTRGVKHYLGLGPSRQRYCHLFEP